jgi:hypothetical protein
MDDIRRYRAMERLCRIRSTYDPAFKFIWLARAARWKVAGDLEVSAYFEECNSNSSDKPASVQASPTSDSPQIEMDAAA